MADTVTPLNVQNEIQELNLLKRTPKYRNRNFTYFLLREAMEGRFRWPNDWPSYKRMLVMNMVKPIVLRQSNMLMGKGFEYNVVPLDQEKEQRQQAQLVEKILDRIIDHSGGMSMFSAGAQDASLLGDGVFKVYLDEESGWPMVSQCLPDYFYGIAAGTNYMGDLAKVFYTYYVDPLEAQRLFKDKYPDKARNFKTEDQLPRDVQADNIYGRRDVDYGGIIQPGLRKRVPIVEIWTDTNYCLIVGGETLYNDANPYGFVPFTSVPNIRLSGQVEGQGDAEQVLVLNEQLNQTVSNRAYVVDRWLNPTLIWEGAPQNYREILAAIVGGGGAIPARIGAKIQFLQQADPGAGVDDLLDRIRTIALENANINELALTGQVHGSVNTAMSLDRQLLPITTLVDAKRRSWEIGLRRIAAQLLTLATNKKAKDDYGSAFVADEDAGTADSGETLELLKESIGEYRDVSIVWGGTRASDDPSLANLEIQKYVSQVQSLFTTLKNLGHDFPLDEIERMKDERADPDLHPEIANQTMQAATPLMQTQMQQQQDQQQQDGNAQQSPFAQQGAAQGGDMSDIAEMLYQAQSNGRHDIPGPLASAPQSPQSRARKKKKPQAAPAVGVDAQGNPIIG